MRCVRARPSLATRWRRAHRGRSSEGCSCPYLFRWRSLREEWSCGAWWCSFPDKPPAHSENRWGRERGRSIPFPELPYLLQKFGGNFVGHTAILTSILPKFLPWNMPIKEEGAFSSPSTISSRYLRRPVRTHSLTSRKKSGCFEAKSET